MIADNGADLGGTAGIVHGDKAAQLTNTIRRFQRRVRHG